MNRFMLDTNTVSGLIRADPGITRRVVAAPQEALCISSITEAELQFGVARRPEATRLRQLVREFLLRVETLPWDGAAAERYGTMRAELERHGRQLSALDQLIAAHALSIDATLVTDDRALGRVEGLVVENWRTA